MSVKCERNCRDCNIRFDDFVSKVIELSCSNNSVMISDPWQNGDITPIHAKHSGFAYITGGDGNLYSVSFTDACRNYHNGQTNKKI